MPGQSQKQQAVSVPRSYFRNFLRSLEEKAQDEDPAE